MSKIIIVIQKHNNNQGVKKDSFHLKWLHTNQMKLGIHSGQENKYNEKITIGYQNTLPIICNCYTWYRTVVPSMALYVFRVSHTLMSLFKGIIVDTYVDFYAEPSIKPLVVDIINFKNHSTVKEPLHESSWLYHTNMSLFGIIYLVTQMTTECADSKCCILIPAV